MPSEFALSEAARVFSGKDSFEKARLIVEMAFHEGDWRWVQDRCLELIEADPVAREAALGSLGDLARIHGTIDLEKVLPVLLAWREDANFGAAADEVLKDFEHPSSTRRQRTSLHSRKH